MITSNEIWSCNLVMSQLINFDQKNWKSVPIREKPRISVGMNIM